MDKEQKKRVKNKRKRSDQMENQLRQLENKLDQLQETIIKERKSAYRLCEHPLDDIEEANPDVYECNLCKKRFSTFDYKMLKKERKQEQQNNNSSNRGRQWI